MRKSISVLRSARNKGYYLLTFLRFDGKTEELSFYIRKEHHAFYTGIK
jgi:hypothetical protein